MTELDRAEIARSALGVVAMQGRYEHLLRSAVGGGVLPLEARAECMLALHAISEFPPRAAVESPERAVRASFAHNMARTDRALGWLGDGAARALTRDALTLAQDLASVDDRSPECWPSDPLERLAAQHSLPPWLLELWAPLSPQPGALALLAAAANTPGPLVVRSNSLVCSRAELLAALEAEGVRAEVTPLSPLGVRLLDGRPQTPRGGGVKNLLAWTDGRLELQDEGSQLLALALAAQPDDAILDFCAGNGGKTLALAAAMRGRGSIVAHDVDAARLEQIAGRAARARVPPGMIQTARTPSELASLGGARGFTRVLVDAPCSSSGVLRRHPSLRWELSRAQCERELPALQRAILESAAAHVARGGVLLYATCSLLGCENEQVACAFEERWRAHFEPLPFEPSERIPPDAHLGLGCRGSRAFDAESAKQPEGSGTHMAWLLPHLHGTDGFFMARWRRCS